MDNASTLNFTIPSAKDNDSFKNSLLKLKSANKQVSLQLIFELAVQSHTNAFTRFKAQSLVQNVNGALYKANLPSVVIPVLNLLLAYGLLRNVQSKADMLHYMTDLMFTFKKITNIHLINPPTVRGTIVVDFGTNILNGDYPSQAYAKATLDKKIETRVAWPINSLNITKDGSTFNFKTNRNQTSVNNNRNNNRNSNRNANREPNKNTQSPLKKKCDKCHQLVQVGTFPIHNTRYCTANPRNRR